MQVFVKVAHAGLLTSMLPMSESQSGVPGPGEMTILSYVPAEIRSESAGQVSRSLVITSGTAAGSRQMCQPVAHLNQQ